MTHVKHFGVFEFNADVTPDQIAGCFEAMRGMLGRIPGMLDFECGPYDSPRA